MIHEEEHRSHRSGWLRAGVLGANDGLVSTASLLIGMAVSGANQETILLAGAAGLIAGSMSMAAGEYVSVSSQADTEQADLALEVISLEENYHLELEELAEIYQQRGLDKELSLKVADQLMQHDALDAHARDEIGLHDRSAARPIQAAGTSAFAFLIGGLFPMLSPLLVTGSQQVFTTVGISMFFLILLGSTSAHIGGVRPMIAVRRVLLWGIFAMAITALGGWLLGHTL